MLLVKFLGVALRSSNGRFQFAEEWSKIANFGELVPIVCRSRAKMTTIQWLRISFLCQIVAASRWIS